MSSGFLAVEQARFSQQYRARARGGERGAGGVAVAQPCHFGAEAAVQRFAWRDGQLRHADDVRRAAFGESGFGLDPHAVGSKERLLALRYDHAAEQREPGRPSTITPQSRPADLNMSYMPKTAETVVSGKASMATVAAL